MYTKAAIALLIGSPVATVAGAVFPRDYNTNPAQAACAQLKSAFPNNYVDQSSANYTIKEDLNWSSNCRLPAACFFSPTNKEQVARGLSIVVKAGSQFAVRNGGHNPNANFASVGSNGVLFDLSGLNSLTLSKDNTIMYAGTGNKGGDVQRISDSVGRSAVTGLDTSVGISGLTLGGGYTHFSQLNGLVTDNIVNFEVVLADSSIVNANATHNTDLYRALRGGGNNFGIVTRFDMKTSPVHNVWYTSFTFKPSDYKKFMPALAKVQANLENEPKANFNFLVSAQFALIRLFYAGPTVDRPSVFAPFFEITPDKTEHPPTNSTMYELIKAFSGGSDEEEEPFVAIVKSNIHKPNADFYVGLFEQLQKYSLNTTSANVALAIKPLNSRVAPVGTQQAGGVPNSLNIQPISQTWTQVGAQYEDEKDKDRLVRDQKNIVNWMTENARRKDISLPNLFANDAAADQNVMASYGHQSLANLKAVSRKYDPKQVFQRLQAGGFRVSTA